MTEKTLELHPHWKGGALGGWGDSKCDYCEFAADMICAGYRACYGHRERLLKERGHLAEEAYVRKLKELGERSG
jgi:hypothetical protein